MSDSGFSFSKLAVMYAHSPALSNTPRSTGVVAVMPRSWETWPSMPVYRSPLGSAAAGAGVSGDAAASAGSHPVAAAEPEGDGSAEADEADGDAVADAVAGAGLAVPVAAGLGLAVAHALTSRARRSGATPADRRWGAVIAEECATRSERDPGVRSFPNRDVRFLTVRRLGGESASTYGSPRNTPSV